MNEMIMVANMNKLEDVIYNADGKLYASTAFGDKKEIQFYFGA
jgi:hypothetical protein